jgi:VWFA-related protein
MHLKQLFESGVCALVCALPLQSQANPQLIPEDEIRLSSRPYTPPATDALRVQSNLVEVGVVVRDSKGQPVAGLHQSDFQVFDNGKLQTITFFSTEGASTGAAPAAKPLQSSTLANDSLPQANNGQTVIPGTRPRFIALFFDDLSMPLGDLVPARKAAQALVDAGRLEPGDRVGIFTASHSVTLGFTGDMEKLAASLAQLRTQLRTADEGPAACPPMMPHQAHLIVNVHDDQALNLGIEQGIAGLCLLNLARSEQVLMVQRRADQVLSMAEQLGQATLSSLGQVIVHLSQMPGRRVLILVSSGFLSATLQRQMGQLVEAALRSDIVINSLDAKGLATDVSVGVSLRPGGRIRGDLMAYAEVLKAEQREVFNDLMSSLSRDTGGVFFHNNNDLDKGLRSALAVPEARYILSFPPKDLKPDGRLHNLKVKLAVRGGLSVDARRGYFAPTKKQQQPAQSSGLGALDSAVSATGRISDLPAESTVQIEKPGDGAPFLRVTIHVDVSKLPFQHRADRSLERLRLITALFDAQGKFLEGEEAVIDLALKDATLAQLAGQGFTQKLSLRAPAGSYNLREVVQEGVQGRIAALSHPVEIP